MLFAASLMTVHPNGIIRPLNMVAVAQWQSATLWMWMLWVQIPSGTPKRPLFEGVLLYCDKITFYFL